MPIHESIDDRADERAMDFTPPGGAKPPAGAESPDDAESPGDGEPPSGEEPLCSEEEFAEEVRELVAEDAPRVFALVEEHGERYDAWVCAWGLAFDDRVEVFSTASRLRLVFRSAERAQQRLSRRRKIRLVWADTATARQPEQVG